MDKEAKDKAKRIKKHGAMHFLRTTLFMVKVQSPRKATLKTDAVKLANEVGLWRSLAGAVRPLHHLPHCEPQPPALPATRPDLFHDVLMPPPSPPWPPDEVDGMSQYGSAQDLKELDRQEEGGGDDDRDVDGGDDAIDDKAEEFISRFYQQMRLQRSDLSAVSAM